MAESEIFHNGVRYVSTREAAAKVGLSHSYISKLCRRGLQGARFENFAWYVNVEALRAYLLHKASARRQQLEQLAAKRKKDLVGYESVREIPVRIAPLTVPPAFSRSASKRVQAPSMFLPVVIASILLVFGASAGILRFNGTGSQGQFASAFSPIQSVLDSVGGFFSGLFKKPDTQIVYVPIEQPAKPAAATISRATTTSQTIVQNITQQPIRERVVERVIEKVTPGITTSSGISAADLFDLETRLNNRISLLSNTSAPLSMSQNIAAGGNNIFYTSSPASQRIDQLTGTQITNASITGGTISGANISGGNITATEFSGLLGIGEGGTGTSTAPGLGDLLIGDGAGGYSLVSTSTLGLTGGGTFLGLSDTPNSLSSGDLLYADATDNIAALPASSNGLVLKLVGGFPTWAPDIQGSGGGAGAWSTTTDSLAVYTADPADVVIIGNSATTTNGNILEVSGNALFRNSATVANILTTSRIVATSTIASQLPYASTTAITSTNASTTNLVISGTPSTLLKTDATGRVVAAVSGVDYAAAGASGFSTTSADYWKLANSFFSTTSVDYWKSATNFFSTTSADFLASQRNFFSTSSANYFLAQNGGLTFSTTSTDFWSTQRSFFSTTSVAYWKSVTDLFSTSSSNYLLSSIDKGFFFATTSANAWKLVTDFFATTSTDFWKSQNNFFSSTSAEYFASQRDNFSTTSASFFVNASTTIAKTYANNTFVGTQTFLNASTTNITSGYASTSLLYANGLGGCSAGQYITWSAGTFGCSTDISSSFAYLFPSNSTSTLLNFTGGLTAYASSTIGNGTQGGGLTINGGATTTGNALVQGSLSIGNLSNTAVTITGVFQNTLQLSGSLWNASNGGYYLQTGSALAATPVYSFKNNGDTGIFSANAEDFIGFSAGGVERARITTIGIGIGTTTPGSALAIQGNLFLAGNITSTSTIASIFPYASTTAITSSVASTSLLYANGLGACSAGEYITWSAGTFGCSTDISSSFAYLFPGNATSTLLNFNGGLTAYASSTIGNGTQGGGLTISGGATTTGIFELSSAWLKSGGVTLGYASSTNGATIFGLGAGGAISTTSISFIGNTAFGYQSLSKIQNGFNTAVGYQSLQNAPNTYHNTAIGYQALQQGGNDFNTAVGDSALHDATTGQNNTAVGYLTQESLTSGMYNVAVGNSALFFNLAGSNNVALGYEALRSVGGSGNTAVGYQSGYTLTTQGIYNTFLGYQAGRSASTASSSIAIGRNVDLASATAAQQLNIGNVLYGSGMYGGATMSSAPTTNGSIGIGTSTPWAKLSLQANNGDTATTLFAISSSTASATSTLFSISNTGAINTMGTIVSTANSASTFPYASTTAITSSVASSSLLYVNGLGGCSAGQYLTWNSGSFGCSTDITSSFAYLFPNNATSTLLNFSGGLTAYASTTIGDGSQAGGLTINGGATTTGNAYFGGNVGIGTANPAHALQAVRTSGPTVFSAVSYDNANSGTLTYGTISSRSRDAWSGSAAWGSNTTLGDSNDPGLIKLNNSLSGWGIIGYNQSVPFEDQNYFHIDYANASGTATSTRLAIDYQGNVNIGVLLSTPNLIISAVPNALLSTDAQGSVVATTTTGLLSNVDKGFYFSTTSADAWKLATNFFSTTSADFLATQRNYFSTTSADFFVTQRSFFSTTSTDYWKSITNFFSTTSAEYFASQRDNFSTTSAIFFVNASTTIPKTYTNNTFTGTNTFDRITFNYSSSTLFSSFATASTTNLIVSSAPNTLLKTTANGTVVAAVAGTDYLTTATTFGYLFPNNSTTTLLNFNGGLTAYASSTIGNGTRAGGLTISGGATTTGIAYFVSNAGFGTTNPGQKIDVVNGNIRSWDGSIYHVMLNSTGFISGRTNATNGNIMSFADGNGATAFEINAQDNRVGGIGIVASIDATDRALRLGSNNGIYYFGSSTPSGVTISQTLTPTIPNNNITGKDFIFLGGQTVGPQNVRGGTVYVAGGNGSGGGVDGNVILAHNGSATRGNVGIGTSTPYSRLTIWATSTNPSIFEAVSSASSTIFSIGQSGATTTNFAISTIASGSLLKTTSGGALVAAIGGTDFSNFGYLFPSNATSTLLNFTGGLTAYASSTIGNGTQAGGLTINGGATTTGDLYVWGSGNGSAKATISRLINDWDSSALLNFNSGVGTTYWSVGMRRNAAQGDDFIIGNSNDDGNPEFIIDRTSGNIGIASTSPWAKLSIHANTGETNRALFAIASSTASATSTLFTVLNTGNVGIGTSSPRALFDINGHISDATDLGFTPIAIFGNNVDATTGITMGNLTNANEGDFKIAIKDVSDNSIYMSNTSPNNNNAIFGANRGTSAYLATTGSGKNLTIGTGGISHLILGSTNVERMRINSTGQIGIGTTTPRYALQIATSSFPQLALSDGNNTNGWSLRSVGGNFYLASTSPLTFATSTNLALAITGNGNLGLGTSTPGSALSVNGNQFIAGNITSGANFASVFSYASTTAISANLASTSLLFANGLGGCSAGQYITWSAGAFGCSIDQSGSFAYLFPGNATTTLLNFTGGLTAFASSTIGNGTQADGLTISGGATTTLNAYFAGKVGVGTTSPWATLSITAPAGAVPFAVSTSTSLLFSIATSGVVRVGSSGATNGSAISRGDLYVQDDLEVDDEVYLPGLTNGAGNGYVCWDSINGRLTQTGATCGGGGGGGGDGDLAEWRESLYDIEPGTIVITGNEIATSTVYIPDPVTQVPTGDSYETIQGKMEVATYGTRNRVMGAIATAPSLQVGKHIIASSSHPELIGLAGQIPVKMTLDGGSIAIGDPITVSSSTPGKGMKATHSGRIIGYALEPFDTANDSGGDGMIEVTINVQDWVNFDDIASLTSTSTEALSNPFATQFFASLFSRMTGWLADAGNGITKLFAKEIFAERVEADELCAKKADGTPICVTGEQLESLLQGNTTSAPPPASPPPAPPTDETPPAPTPETEEPEVVIPPTEEPVTEEVPVAPAVEEPAAPAEEPVPPPAAETPPSTPEPQPEA